MNQRTPRMRMFAGPNGSGKSTMINKFINEKNERLLGIYINADDIEKNMVQSGLFNFANYNIDISKEKILQYFNESTLLQNNNLLDSISLLKIEDNIVLFEQGVMNSYYASVLVYMVRHELVEQKIDFTFETVMSSPDKVDFLKKAQDFGFRTYLYYIATDDPIINIQRVKNRVSLGGHDVPEDKIRKRYKKSLALLWDAIKYSNRAYIFDSSSQSEIIAETEDRVLEYKVEQVPYWFIKAIRQTRLHKIKRKIKIFFVKVSNILK